MEDEEDLRRAVASAVRVMTAEGLMDFNGHVSVRVPRTSRVLVNSREAGRATVEPDDIVTVDATGQVLAGRGRPPSELAIHLRIYAAREDVGAVAHLHPQVATVFTIADLPLVPVFLLGSIFPPEGVPVFDAPDLIRTPDQGDAVARALGPHRAVLLRGHGAVVVGEDLPACFAASVWLEENARKYLWARSVSLGHVRRLTDAEVSRLRASLWERSVIQKTWDHYMARGRRLGLL